MYKPRERHLNKYRSLLSRTIGVYPSSKFYSLSLSLILKDSMEDEVKLIFDKFDKNGDGRISTSELKEMFRTLGSEITSEELKRIKSEIDKNGDGYIDLKEFAEFHYGVSDINGAGAEQCGTKELRDAFDLYDIDKNGLISASELHVVLRKLGDKCSLGDCRRMISSVDADGDGSVNFDEFKKMMTRS